MSNVDVQTRAAGGRQRRSRRWGRGSARVRACLERLRLALVLPVLVVQPEHPGAVEGQEHGWVVRPARSSLSARLSRRARGGRGGGNAGPAQTRAPGTPGRSQSQQRASPPRRPALPAPPSRPRGPTADGPFARRRRRWPAREASRQSRRAVQGQGRNPQKEKRPLTLPGRCIAGRRAQGAGRRARGPLRVDGAGDEQVRQQGFREVRHRKEREPRPRVLRRPAPAPLQPGSGGERPK
jgi:hypothetical protein